MPKSDLEVVRGLGTNLVFFDTIQNSSFADDIALDNFDAITKLLGLLHKKKQTKVVFFGCLNTFMSSSIEREQAFDQLSGGKKYLINVNKKNWAKEVFLSLKTIHKENCQGILSANGYFALEIKKQILKNFPHLKDLPMVTIDNEEPHFMDAFGIDRIAQPYFEFGKRSFELLKRQNDLSVDWKANQYLLKGELILTQKQ